jgi:hypothetical protein
MLYIDDQHQENEQKVKLLIRQKNLDLKKIQKFIEQSLVNSQERLSLLKPVMSEKEQINQELLQTHAEILLSFLRVHNGLGPQ